MRGSLLGILGAGKSSDSFFWIATSVETGFEFEISISILPRSSWLSNRSYPSLDKILCSWIIHLNPLKFGVFWFEWPKNPQPLGPGLGEKDCSGYCLVHRHFRTLGSRLSRPRVAWISVWGRLEKGFSATKRPGFSGFSTDFQGFSSVFFIMFWSNDLILPIFFWVFPSSPHDLAISHRSRIPWSIGASIWVFLQQLWLAFMFMILAVLELESKVPLKMGQFFLWNFPMAITINYTRRVHLKGFWRHKHWPKGMLEITFRSWKLWLKVWAHWYPAKSKYL